MAVKMSNQITIIEHKKIVEIKEWYLATFEMKDVTKDTNGWGTAIPTIDSKNKYLWNYEETIYSLGESDTTEPVIIGVYGETGSSGASLQVKYINSEDIPNTDDISKWSNTVPAPEQGKKTYMIQKLSTETEWSTPIQISGTDGKNGEANVEINNDGYWVINGEQTEVKAEGSDGKSPQITIGDDGYWYIDGSFTGTKAEGEAGKDGADIEYVYYRNNNGKTPSTPSYSNNKLPDGWSASPQGIDESHMYEFVSVRTKRAGETTWSAFSTPVVWSKWGEKGQDGDGIEYKYHRNNSSTKPAYPGTVEWTDDPKGVTSTQQYEYVVQLKTTVVDGVKTTTPSGVALWAKYGATGAAGKGISAILNYYATTKTTDAPQDSDWQLNQPKNDLSPEYKYLWNYEEIQYTTGDPTITEPAIIGAYGDSGTGSVDFQIYSTDGFEFSEDVSSIELKTVAFYSGQSITSGATYQWKWWNPDLNTYENIANASNSTLTVKSTDTHAYSSIKCVMRYDGVNYEDHVTLTKKATVYTSMIKFIDGSNVFDPSLPYLFAYVELYKDQQLEHTIGASQLWNGNNIIKNGQVETDFTDISKVDSGLMYFLYKDGARYKTVLGRFNQTLANKDTEILTGSIWDIVEESSKYEYVNSIYNDTTSNIIIISKEDVSNTKELNIEVRNTETNNIVSATSATIIDLNDPIISNTPPENVKYGQLWLDTSVNPYILKIYTKSKNSYTLGNPEKVLILTESTSSGGTNATTETRVYGDGVIVNDDESISLINEKEVTFSYDSYKDAEVLRGKFFFAGIYAHYMPEDGTITRDRSSYGTRPWNVYANNAQQLTANINTGGDWEYFAQQNGGAIYTSRPEIYNKGDLWILAEGETCGIYGEGTILRAMVTSNTFNDSHWTDSLGENGDNLRYIKETFDWSDDGLKIRQQSSDKDGNIVYPFYVHIDSTRMGFHSVEYLDGNPENDVEVVHIGTNSATIQNAVFEGKNGTTFNNNAIFNSQININKTTTDDKTFGFIWKIEEDGSLSLAIGS